MSIVGTEEYYRKKIGYSPEVQTELIKQNPNYNVLFDIDVIQRYDSMNDDSQSFGQLKVDYASLKERTLEAITSEESNYRRSFEVNYSNGILYLLIDNFDLISWLNDSEEILSKLRDHSNQNNILVFDIRNNRGGSSVYRQ